MRSPQNRGQEKLTHRPNPASSGFVHFVGTATQSFTHCFAIFILRELSGYDSVAYKAKGIYTVLSILEEFTSPVLEYPQTVGFYLGSLPKFKVFVAKE